MPYDDRPDEDFEDDIPLPDTCGNPVTTAKVSDQQILDALRRHRGIRVQAARSLGITSRALQFRIERLRVAGIDVPASTYDGRSGIATEDLRPVPARPAAPDPDDEDDSPAEAIAEQVRRRLRHGHASESDMAAEFGCTRGQIVDALDDLVAEGLNLQQHSGEWYWTKTPAPGHARTDLTTLTTDKDGWLTVGVTSDNHLCSKYSRLDVLEDLYDRFAEEGVRIVLNAGNWIDGEARFNMHDLLVHGMDAQLRYLAAHYPQREGITTYAIAGDDHEGWYAQREGVDIGRLAELRMRDAGREDWRDMGYMEAFLRLVHGGTGAESMLHLIHPGGGTAYAESYTVQKIVEGYDGGEKPAVLIAGHYHKLAYNLIRNVHALQPGCTQDQTPFARKKKIRFAVGGCIVRMRLDEQGAVRRFQPEILNYFVRGYANNRWSHSGDVVLADRGAA